MTELTQREFHRQRYSAFWRRMDEYDARVTARADEGRARREADLSAVWDRHYPPDTEQHWRAFDWLRRLIIRAAPTCTLWVRDIHFDVYRFRFNKRWTVRPTEYRELL